VLQESAKPEVYKKLLFGFCFFHAILQDRRKFGPIGWNIPYGFTFEDLVTCRRQLKAFVDDYDRPPIKSLVFMGAAINYGGRVTDDKDKRLIQTILAMYISDKLVDEDQAKLSRSGIYYVPNAESKDDVIDYVKTLPLVTAPEAFGMDDNCEITCAMTESNQILESTLAMAPSKSSGGGKSAADVQDEIAGMILSQTPELFDLDELEEEFPTRYDESSNTVLKQESFKYNRLLRVMRATLPLFRKALKGLVAMSEELDAMGVALYGNIVPPNFEKAGYLNEMPLSSWIKDLARRMAFLNNWREIKLPIVCWISGFFFPQAYLTAVLQNNARKTKTAIDRLSYAFEVDSKAELDGSNYKERPDTGCRIYGLFIEGCRWSTEDDCLANSFPKVLFGQIPPVLMTPLPERKIPEGTYQAPIYKTLSRRGTLSTTGHSTNFVMMIDLKTKVHSDAWIVAGVACFLALRS
jgi:dynein heavy chain